MDKNLSISFILYRLQANSQNTTAILHFSLNDFLTETARLDAPKPYLKPFGQNSTQNPTAQDRFATNPKQARPL